MKHTLHKLLLVLGLFSLSSVSHAESWLLTTVWAPGVCATEESGSKLCQSKNAEADHLLSLQLIPLQGHCPDNHSAAMENIVLDSTYLAVLDKYNWAENWREHGACSGMTEPRYLSTMIDMARSISQTRLGKFFKDFKGKSVDKNRLLHTLGKDYFIGADRKVSLLCRQNHLVGVWFYPRDWSELFVNAEQGGMLNTVPATITPPPDFECLDQIQL